MNHMHAPNRGTGPVTGTSNETGLLSGTSRGAGSALLRRGVTLLEVATVIAVMGIIGAVGLMMGMLASPVRFAKSANEQIDRMQSLDALAVQFRSDVAAAAAVSESLGPYRSGEETIILRYDSGAEAEHGADQDAAPAENAEGKHVIWHWESGQVWRVDWDGRVRRRIPMTTAGLFESVSFATQRHEDQVELTVRLEPRYRKKYRGVRPVFMLSTVQGADRL